MLDSATVTSARYVPVPARTQTNFCCRYVRLSPTPTAPLALHRVSSLSIEIVSRRRRLSIFETTRASHSSPTKASTSARQQPRLKPSSRARSVEKCRVVPLTESVSVGRSTVRFRFRSSSHLPLRSRDASTTPWTVPFSKPATCVSMRRVTFTGLRKRRPLGSSA